MKRLVECVPNFSEGRDREVIERIADSIRSVGGVSLAGIDMGDAAGRSVMTFAGSPEAVCEAAFLAVETAGRLIDMRLQHGTHPRTGATDVLPLIPLEGITLDECASLARTLAERVYRELGIAVNLYEEAALRPERKNLAVCRIGEYEALPERFADETLRPDFAPDTFDDVAARCGVTNIGARDILVAVNFNLDSSDSALAGEIAKDVRESGRKVPAGGGAWIRKPGTLKGVKAIGWYIAEYGCAQVSMNITDINSTPLHRAFEEVCIAAERRGAKVTGTELIGLVPLKVMRAAGRYFTGGLTGLSDEELVAKAVRVMGIDTPEPFDPSRKILEYALIP